MSIRVSHLRNAEIKSNDKNLLMPQRLKWCLSRVRLLDDLDVDIYIKYLRAIDDAKDCLRILNSTKKGLEKQLKSTKDDTQKARIGIQLKLTNRRIRHMQKRVNRLKKHIEKGAVETMREKYVAVKRRERRMSWFGRVILTVRGTDSGLCRVMSVRIQKLDQSEQRSRDKRLSVEQRFPWIMKRVKILEHLEKDIYIKLLRVIDKVNSFIPSLESEKIKLQKQLNKTKEETKRGHLMAQINGKDLEMRNMHKELDAFHKHVEVSAGQSIELKRVTARRAA